MKMRGISAGLFALIAAIGGSLFSSDVSGADLIWTISTAAPTQAGVMTLGVRLNNVPFSGRNFAVSLTGQETAAEKATKIASVMDNTTFPVTASANGNKVTVDTSLEGLFVSSLWVVSDHTGEVNQLLGMVPGDSSAQVAIVEYPTESFSTVPAAGQMASVAFSTDTDNVNGSVVSDGTSTAGMLLSQLNASMGLSWTTHSDPTTGGTYLESGLFDPMSASIEWNAFTGDSLANFGLDFLPEPASLSVLLFGCVALLPHRRAAATTAAKN